MNKHIELVKKWLADPESVTKEELKDNAKASDAAQAYAQADTVSASKDYATADTYAATAAEALITANYIYRYTAKVYAAYAAYAAAAEATGYPADTAHWVKQYEELTN